MTIASTTSKVRYTADGSTKVFAVKFRFCESSDLDVYVTPSGGALTELTEETDYTIADADGGTDFANGGNVTLSAAPASGSIVTIARSLPLTQEMDLTTNGSIPAETVEAQHDREIMIAQQHQEELDRCFKLSEDTAGTATPDAYLAELHAAVNAALASKTSAATSETNAATSATSAAESAALAGTPIGGLALYVSASGSDSTGDGSSTKPFASINAAVAKARLYRYLKGAAVTINILAGTYTYTEQQIVTLSQSDVVVSVIGAGADKTILSFPSSSGIKLSGIVDGTFSGLTLIHGTTANPTDDSRGLYITDCASYVVSNVSLSYWHYGIIGEKTFYTASGTITLIDCTVGCYAGWKGQIASSAAWVISGTSVSGTGIKVVQDASYTGNSGSVTITNRNEGFRAAERGRIRFAYAASNDTLTNVTTSYTPALNTVGNNMAIISDSTATLGFDCSKSANGYTKLPNGMILQWGTIAAASHDQEYDFGTITFPITFPTAVLNVSATMITSASAASGFDTIPGVKAVTTASAQFYSGCTSSGTETYGLYWFAIGY